MAQWIRINERKIALAFTHVPYLNGDKIHDSFTERECDERGEREFRVTNDEKVPDPVSLIIRFRLVAFTVLSRCTREMGERHSVRIRISE